MEETTLPPIDEAEIRKLLECRKGEWQAIATKAEVSFSWLSKFFNQHIENPGINTLRRVRSAINAIDAAKPAAQQS